MLVIAVISVEEDSSVEFAEEVDIVYFFPPQEICVYENRNKTRKNSTYWIDILQEEIEVIDDISRK